MLRRAVLFAVLLVLVLPMSANVLEHVARQQEGKTLRWSTGLYDTESSRSLFATPCISILSSVANFAFREFNHMAPGAFPT